MNEEEKENMQNSIEKKYKNITEKGILNNLTYAECLFILTPKNKYCDEIKGLSLLKICEIFEKLQKENEEWREAYQEEKDKQFKLIQNTNNTIKTANIAIKDLQEKLKEVISVQKVKDKIEEYKKMLLSCNRFSDVDRIKAINERILELQELIEKED